MFLDWCSILNSQFTWITKLKCHEYSQNYVFKSIKERGDYTKPNMKLEEPNLYLVHRKIAIAITYDYPNNRMTVTVAPSPPTNQNLLFLDCQTYR